MRPWFSARVRSKERFFLALLTEMRAAHHLRAGQQLAREGRFVQAVERYRNVLGLQPRNARALLHMARALVAMGDREGAVQAALQALELKPRDAAFLILAGEVQLDAGHPNAATELFERALERSRQNDLARAYLRLANWRSRGDILWAEELREAGLPDSTAFLVRLLMTVEEHLRPAKPPAPAPVTVPSALPFCAPRFNDALLPGVRS